MGVNKNRMKIKDFCATVGWLPERTLRKYILHGSHNGLFESGAVLKVMGTVLVDVDNFEKWVESQNIFKKV